MIDVWFNLVVKEFYRKELVFDLSELAFCHGVDFVVISYPCQTYLMLVSFICRIISIRAFTAFRKVVSITQYDNLNTIV